MSVTRLPLFPPVPATIGVVVALALATGASGPAWGAASEAQAVRAAVTCTASPNGVDVGNLDSDGIADLVVGAPTLAVGGARDAGGVDVHLSSGSEQRITAAGLGLTEGTQADARFGAAISVADVDDDGCSDLAVGAPGAGGSGRVYMLHGSPSGIGTAVTTITAPDGAAGDDFGAAVAETIRGVQVEDLWVGAPGRSVDGHADAGEVYHYVFDASGTPTYVGHASYAGTVVAGSVHPGIGSGRCCRRGPTVWSSASRTVRSPATREPGRSSCCPSGTIRWRLRSSTSRHQVSRDRRKQVIITAQRWR